MPTLQEQGEQLINTSLANTENTGIILVVPGKRAPIALATWAIHTCINDLLPNKRPQDFRALYASHEIDLQHQVLDGVKKLRGKIDFTFFRRLSNGTLPPLRMVNFGTRRVLLKEIKHFPPDSLDLLVLDERSANGLTGLQRFIQHARPLFTIVIARHVPSASSPWRQFGEPHVLKV